ncbi:MAG: transposase, partial [Acidimicrobiales bacterium]
MVTQQDGRGVHLFAAMVHREGAVIAQRDVGHKDNEITEFGPLLAGLDLENKVVTADAMHAQRAHATFLTERGADYLFTVKANQP